MSHEGRIDPPKAGRGHATLVKCWRLLNLNHVMMLYDIVPYKAYDRRHNVSDFDLKFSNC